MANIEARVYNPDRPDFTHASQLEEYEPVAQATPFPVYVQIMPLLVLVGAAVLWMILRGRK